MIKYNMSVKMKEDSDHALCEDIYVELNAQLNTNYDGNDKNNVD